MLAGKNPGFIFLSVSSPKHMGLLDPATSDGRVIFFLPWEGKLKFGTCIARKIIFVVAVYYGNRRERTNRTELGVSR